MQVSDLRSKLDETFLKLGKLGKNIKMLDVGAPGLSYLLGLT